MTDGSRRVVVRRVVAVGRDMVWPAVTEPALIGRWFVPCRALGAGGYRLRFEEPEGPRDKHVQVLTCDPAAHAFRFRLADPGYPDSEVVVRLQEPAAGGTRVLLRHDDPPADLVEGYRDGWARYLSTLAATLEASPR